MDCVERLDLGRVNKKVLESLVKCGAFDWTGRPRQALFEAIGSAISVAQKVQDDKASNQTSLFGGAIAQQVRPRVTIPDVGEWATAVRLGHERDSLGFFITGHPVAAFSDVIKKSASCSIDLLHTQTAGEEVAIAGMVSQLRKVRTKRGSQMGFVTVEDQLGGVECVFFSEPWAQSQRVLASEQPLFIRGKLEKSASDAGEVCKIIADSAELLTDIRERRTRAVHLVFEGEELDGKLDALSTLLQESSGSAVLHLHLRLPDMAWVQFDLPQTVVPDEHLLQGIETLFRRADVPRLR
jgi:DNA polymerase-3 subunit alpha